jgi:hypothetical protein
VPHPFSKAGIGVVLYSETGATRGACILFSRVQAERITINACMAKLVSGYNLSLACRIN